jgi:hypothetical protein
MHWHILTGEYPPRPGGVADYTQAVARGLAAAGDAVEVWAPGCAPAREPRLAVHDLPDHFGPRALSTLSRRLRRGPTPYRLLVQYVPQAFGWKGLNVPFCLWLRAQPRESTWLMFHEVAFPVSRQQPLMHNGLGLVTRGMAAIAASAASRAFVSIPAWEPMVRRAAAVSTPIGWMPVPSAIPVSADATAIAAVRQRFADGNALVGHFGTNGRLIGPLLAEAVNSMADAVDVHVLLIGRGSEAAAVHLRRQSPAARDRIHATGTLDARAVSHHVSACDVMMQPYPDGVSSRRTSVMVALSHGRPVVTTAGALTESLWHDGAVVLCEAGDGEALAGVCVSLARRPSEATHLGAAGKALYDAKFDLRHTIARLRAPDTAFADWPAAS